MPSAAHQYTAELGRELRFHATWTPGMPLALGVIGTTDRDNVFAPVSSLDQFGIKFEEEPPSEDTEETFSYASANAVEIGLKLAGQTSALTPSLPIDRAGLGIQFKREYATVFRADGAKHWRIANEPYLAQEVVSLIKAGRWDKDWSIVTHLVRAETTTVLLSRSSGARIEFSLSADVEAGGLEVLSADANAMTFASREMQLTIVGAGGMTPLFRAKRVRRRWFSKKYELHASYSDELTALEQTKEDLEDDLFEDIPIYNGSVDEPAEEDATDRVK